MAFGDGAEDGLFVADDGVANLVGEVLYFLKAFAD